MKRTIPFALALGLMAALMTMFAATASAFPTQTGTCSSCHGTGGVSVKATEISNNNVTATYNVTVSGGTGVKGWAVKDGSTNIANSAGATGSFTVAVGKTYTVWGVDNATGSGSVTISPKATTTPPTPPTTGTPSPTSTPQPTSTPEPTATPQPPANPSAVCLGCHKAHGNGTTCISCHTASPHEEGEGPNANDAARRCNVKVRVLRHGKAVKGSWVSIFYGDDGQRVKAKTDSKGYATLRNVPKGTRTLKITYKGKLVKTTKVKLSTSTKWLRYRI